jgi:diguanylate cyclase (GGDEF)-like protein
VLPDANLAQGQQVAERLRRFVGKSPIKTSAGEIGVTVSLGVAERSGIGSDIAQLLERADQGLLAAKRAGRDQVVAIPSDAA